MGSVAELNTIFLRSSVGEFLFAGSAASL